MSDENDKNIIKGEFHEERFANFLNDHGIPFLFIEQGPQDEHYSTALKGGEIKRPDFLIYLQIIGHIFIDVKSRYKIESIDASVSHFYIMDDEINSLFSLQSYLLLPLWIAFVSTKKGDDEDFYLIPISVLKHYKDRLKKELGENNDLFNCLFIRIPNSFLKRMTDINDLILVNNYYDFTNIKKEAEIYKELEKKLKDIINDIKEMKTQDYCNIKNH